MNRKLLIFSVVTCLFSWACWLPIVGSLQSSPFESGGVVLLLFFLGAYGPTLSAIVLTFYYEKGNGLRRLFKSLFLFRVGAGWFLVGLLAGPILYGLAVAIYAGFGGSLGAVNHGLLPWIPVVILVSVVFGPLAEELGWRGFALPALDHKRQVIRASILIGLIWSLWHAPLFWAKTGTAISGFPVGIATISWFFFGVTGSSFLYTWLFNNTRGSVFMAVVLHLSMNASGTVTAMLFPDMGLEQRFSLYRIYTLVVWCAVLLVGVLHHFRKPAKQRSD